MTREIWTGPVSYVVQGIGPYAADWPYTEGGVGVTIIMADGTRIALSAPDWSVVPVSSDLRGDVTLSPATAAVYDGARIVIHRDTLREQGWRGLLGEREKGLEAQLDVLTMSVQELSAGLAGAVRTDGPVGMVTAVPGAAIIWGPDGHPTAGPDAEHIRTAGLAASRAEQASADARRAAADALNAVGAYFQTRADLFAELSGHDPGTILATRMEGYVYQVVSADPDVITAGGIMLRVLEGDDGLPAGAFGAVGDGVADDTAALQKALLRTYAPGYERKRPVILAPGTYLVSAPLRIAAPNPMAVYLRGAGQEHTTIKAAPSLTNSALIWFGNSSGHGASRCTIEHLTIDGGGKAANNSGIIYQSAGLSRISHVTVRNCGRAMWLHGCIDTTVEDCNVFTSYEGIMWTVYPIGSPTGPDDMSAQSLQTTRANISRQLRCWLSGIEATATWISGGSFVLAQCTYQACTTNGLANVIHVKDSNEAYSYGGGPLISDNWIEGGAYRYAIHIENTRQCRLFRNHINGTGNAAKTDNEGGIYLDAASCLNTTVEDNSIRGYFTRPVSSGRLANAGLYVVAPDRSFREARNYIPYNTTRVYYHGQPNPDASRDSAILSAYIDCSSGTPVIARSSHDFVQSVTKNSVGDYTVALKFNRQVLTTGRHSALIQPHSTGIAGAISACILGDGPASERVAFTRSGVATDPLGFDLILIGGGGQ